MAKKDNPYRANNVYGKHFKYSVADIPHTDFEAMKALQDQVWELCKKKDSEYGASWCKRGGVGAFFTVWRKVDRLEEQLKKADFNMLDITEDADSTESLDETMKDLANYLYLVLEKRQAARIAAKRLHTELVTSCVKKSSDGMDAIYDNPLKREDDSEHFHDSSEVKRAFCLYIQQVASDQGTPTTEDQVLEVAQEYFSRANREIEGKGIDASDSEVWVAAQAIYRRVHGL